MELLFGSELVIDYFIGDTTFEEIINEEIRARITQ